MLAPASATVSSPRCRTDSLEQLYAADAVIHVVTTVPASAEIRVVHAQQTQRTADF